MGAVAVERRSRLDRGRMAREMHSLCTEAIETLQT
jgi:hypothetical protein